MFINSAWPLGSLIWPLCDSYYW